MMTQSGVDPKLIVNHVRTNGVERAPEAHELVEMKQQGVDTSVILAMQDAVRRFPETVVVRERRPAPVIVEEHVYGSPFYYHHYHGCGPHVGMGVCFH
jgi:hypothetical protein